MDLLASSGGSVPAAAKRKAVRKWVGRRRFWACINGNFAALMGAIGSGGRIGTATAGSAPSHVLSLRGTGGEGSGGTRGIGKVSRLIVELGSRG
jgi:hypothetical protein